MGMDAHHEQVDRARRAAAAANLPPRRYFAYSTILDRAAFEEWRGQHGYQSFELPSGTVAEAVDVDLIYNFPSRWWGGRVAGLVDKPGASVFGLLFEVAGVDWPIIQHKEGGVTHMSVERQVHLRSDDGTVIEATAFTTNPARASSEGPISPRFVDALYSGAVAARLPEPYLARLRAG